MGFLLTALEYLATSWVGKFFLESIVKNLAAYFNLKQDQYRKWRKIDHEAEQSVAPLQKAETAKEIDDASDSALNGF